MNTAVYRRLVLTTLMAAFIAWAIPATAENPTVQPTAPLLIDRARLDRQPQLPTARTATPSAQKDALKNAPDIKPFTLRGVLVQGAPSLEPAALHAAYADRIGSEITIKDIGAISDKIGALYKDAGFPLYSVVVPKQDFGDGTLTVRVTEGYVDNVIIDGDTEDADLDLIRAYAAKIVADQPLHHWVLARYLLLMNDIPGLKVGSRFDPAQSSAGVTLRLTIERKHFDFALNFDNEGSKFISRLQFTATATANSIFQQGDRTEFIYGFPANFNDYHYYGVTHLEPIGTEGTTVQFSTSYLETRPLNSSIDGDAYTAGFTFTVPIIRQQEESLSLIGSLDALNSSNGFLGQTFSNERTRAIRVGAAYVTGLLDGTEVTSVSGVLSQGIDALGARPGGFGTGGPTFTKVNIKIEHDRVLIENVIARLKAGGQYALDAVPASEEFTYGGPDFGRAFGDAEVTGDRGIEAGAEIAYQVPSAWIGLSFLTNPEVYGFYDIGKLWLLNPALRSPDLGQSAGVGARIRVYDKLTLQIEAGFPVECPSQVGSSCSTGRGVFSLGSKF
ncbi:MAG TPA: ShlB/FhaC/HecB family hemolysin secretion/activation protein [Alphaproteobacteria bacterium]|jgi:hemolysin activation/secretion protein|nr:ShlB/FhaC/HecB family hemolysin secretion/activation protein [Alphaproteobacteria bacterium]